MITATAVENQQLLTTARPLWERVLANDERTDSSQTTDIVATMREMVDLSQQLREAQHHLTDLRAQNQSLAWALVMTCEQMRAHIATLRANRGQEVSREIPAEPSWSYRPGPQVLTWAEASDQTSQLLSEWAKRITRFAQELVRLEATATASSGNSLGLSEAIETTLRELDTDLAQAARQLSGPVASGSSNELTEPDPEYTGGGFLRAVRLDVERLTPERFLPDDMTDYVLEPGTDRVLTIPMVGHMREGITIAPGITILAGPNGVGKSVVLEALSHTLQGDRARRTSDYRPLSRRLSAALEIAFHHCPRPQDVWYSSYLSLRESRNPRLSAGEVFRTRLEGMSPKPGVLYLLDEPEVGLDRSLTEEFISWMNDRVEDGCQFIIATHSMTLASLEHAHVIMPIR
ncbi:AAA family ATPase [Streptomyces phaeochromogenes]|uniref:AAA family ATPase n=1 Tax=Streptomyces TaxID=1883 RepID=UPI0033CAE66A